MCYNHNNPSTWWVMSHKKRSTEALPFHFQTFEVLKPRRFELIIHFSVR